MTTTLATIHQSHGTASVTFSIPNDQPVTVDLGRTGKSVSGRKIVDRAFAKCDVHPGPFLTYRWEQ